MAARTHLVTVTDLQGVRQSVEATARAADALSALRHDAWIDRIGPATRLEIQELQHAVTHTVTVQQLERWADGQPARKRESAVRQRDVQCWAASRAGCPAMSFLRIDSRSAGIGRGP